MFKSILQVVGMWVLVACLCLGIFAGYKYGQKDVYSVYYSQNDDEATRVVDPNGEDVSDPQGWWVKNKDTAKYEIIYVAPQWLREKIAAESQ